MSKPLVLVIGETGDWSVAAVAAAVEAAGGRVFTLTTQDFPQRMSLRASLREQWDGWIITSSGDLRLSEVHGVYYRRPRTFDLPAGLSGPEQRFARAQARIGLGGILASIPARWMNRPAALADCEYKPRQLAVAAAVRLHVPATLITNDAEAVREFAGSVGDVVVKPLAEPAVAEAGALSVAYTRLLSADDNRDLAGVEATAHLFQEWIEPRCAVRLTVVGHRLFPVGIYAGSAAARVDWRADYESLSYETIECPPHVADGVRRFLAEFGLTYGAFDFVVQAGTGRWYLLECNAAGQWGWLAEECDLPIANAIAEELMSGRLHD